MKNKGYPLISVIVPIYNGEKFIHSCVDSILNQTYKNIEIILVNDGSTDNTSTILNELKAKNILVIEHDNCGVSETRNKGIKNSNGEYVTFVDVDDYLSPNYIMELYNMINENSADIALFRQPRRFVSETKEEVFIQPNNDVSLCSGKDATLEMLYYKIAIGPWNKLIRKDVIIKNNILFDKKLSYGEGFNFSIDCYQKSKKIVCGNKRLYNYRLDNPDSVMTRFSLKQITGSIYSQEVLQSKLDTNDKDYKKALQYSQWHTNCDCLNSLIGSKKHKEHKDIYLKIYKSIRKNSLNCLSAPISIKEKIKGLCYFISPFITAKIINHFRKRKYTV